MSLLNAYPELATIDAWISATDAKRADIAAQVATEHALEFEAIAPFRREDLPLASFRGLDGLFRFVLVPGGSFAMGVSDSERRVLEELAAPHHDEPSYEFAWGNLFGPASPLWPAQQVSVGPLLFAQNTMGDFGLDEWRTQMGEAFVGEGGDTSTLSEDIEVVLAEHGFRLPTETEWEWCARGGREGEITFKGNELPDEAYYRRIARDLDRSQDPDRDRHARIANDFGLVGFGVHAELCSDTYRARREDAMEHSKVWTDRVVRGGAGATYKWQNPGEWQALLTSHRQRCSGLVNSIGIRPVCSVG